MPQHHVASGVCDRTMNPADGVGSLTQGPRTPPAHTEGGGCITVPTGTAKMKIPRTEAMTHEQAISANLVSALASEVTGERSPGVRTPRALHDHPESDL